MMHKITGGGGRGGWSDGQPLINDFWSEAAHVQPPGFAINDACIQNIFPRKFLTSSLVTFKTLDNLQSNILP